jgi:phosphoglycolate phosphatase
MPGSPTTHRRLVIHRLILWNIDHTLVDVARVSRDAYAEAFRRVTGRPLVALPQLAGASDSEIFFESLALNEAAPGRLQPESGDLLGQYITELAASFGARGHLLAKQGRILPGARDALAAASRLPNVIQTVVTGSIKPNAEAKLRAFGLDGYLDLAIGGFGSYVYPKGTQIMRSLAMAAEKYGVQLADGGSVYLADSVRDVAAAQVGGVRCIGIASGRSTISELRDTGADPVFTDLQDTARIVAAITR